MVRLKKAYILFSFVLLLLFVKTAYSSRQVVIEFLYWDPSKEPAFKECPSCWAVPYEDFLMKWDFLNEIESNYTGQVLVNRTEYHSPEGQAKKQLYLSMVPIIIPNAIIIKSEEGNITIIQEKFNETYTKEVIDAYLTETPPPPPPPPPPLIATLALAFTFGFFETFSPCLIILLSFVLSYTIGEAFSFNKKFSQVMAFGIGFVSATVLVFSALAVGLIMVSSTLDFQFILVWVVCIFAILFGIHLLGFNMFKFLKIKAETKPLIQKLTRKYVFTFFGLVALGFLFYFLDPCIAPVFVAMIATFEPSLLLEFLPLLLFMFCLGVIIPFVGIGLLAGSISKLARSTYRHKSKIRAISGLILIAYSCYLIVSLSYAMFFA